VIVVHCYTWSSLSITFVHPANTAELIENADLAVLDEGAEEGAVVLPAPFISTASLVSGLHKNG